MPRAMAPPLFQSRAAVRTRFGARFSLQNRESVLDSARVQLRNRQWALPAITKVSLNNRRSLPHCRAALAAGLQSTWPQFDHYEADARESFEKTRGKSTATHVTGPNSWRYPELMSIFSIAQIPRGIRLPPMLVLQFPRARPSSTRQRLENTYPTPRRVGDPRSTPLPRTARWHGRRGDRGVIGRVRTGTAQAFVDESTSFCENVTPRWALPDQ